MSRRISWRRAVEIANGAAAAASRRGVRSGHKPFPDFQFPHTLTEGMGPASWQPRFPDHLYLAFTNVMAFSPTDTMSLTHRVKGLMAIQSLISLSVIELILSRVINILPP